MRNTHGFTLVEVVATLIILGVSLVAIMSLFTLNTRFMKTNEMRLVAYNLLQKKIEEIKCEQFSNVVDASGVTYGGYADYSIDVTVTPEMTNSYLKKVDVSVTWADSFGNNQTEIISTYVANHG